MRSLNRIFCFFALSFISLATGAFAQNSVDCVDYVGEPDQKCVYTRIGSLKGINLFVVPEKADVVAANALPNTEFLVYLPKANSDSVDAKVESTGAEVTHLKAVNSGESGLLLVSVSAELPVYNVEVGTALDASSEFAIARVYNFYAPAVEYCLDEDCEKVIDGKSKLQLEVGDTLKVYARAYIPIGDQKGRTDSTLEKSFYIEGFGQAEYLRYYGLSGTELQKSPFGYKIDFHEGRAAFLICATKAVTDGSFSLNSYVDSLFSYEDYFIKGDTNFIVTEKFPGSLQFVNPDMPVLDSAFIFDTNGDGAGDSIAGYFSGRLDSISMEEFYYNWPDDGKFRAHQGEWNQKGGLLELLNVNATIPEDEGKGSLKVHVKSVNTGVGDDVSAKLQDRIGPTIRTANLIKGNGSTDTLEIFFNKDIDEGWNEGEGFIVNGTPVNMEAIVKDGSKWTFVVEAGVVNVKDSISIATTCAKKACPDGFIRAADGNETGKNNPAIVKNSGRVYTDDEKNAFFDRDGDGRMDSASVAFDEPITREELEGMTFRYYWLDTDGNVLEIVPDADDLDLSADGTVIGFSMKQDKLGIKEKLTSIEKSKSPTGEEYGYVTVTYTETKNGKSDEKTMEIGMADRMSPVIAGNFLQPESYQKMASDVFVVEFSEPIDYENVEGLEDAFSFYVDGEWAPIPFASANWSKDGRSVEIRMEGGTKLVDRMNPADSVKFDAACVSFKDKDGNGISGLAPAEMVEGDPRVVMQNFSFVSRDDVDDSVDDAVTFTVADGLTSKEAKKSLGVLMDVSFSTIFEEGENVEPEMDLGEIGLVWELDVFTNLGTFVAHASEKVQCDDRELFDGNCFEHPHQMYLRWNMLSDKGRHVGAGAYVAHFKVRVYGAKKNFKVERFYNWGISGSRKIHSND